MDPRLRTKRLCCTHAHRMPLAKHEKHIRTHVDCAAMRQEKKRIRSERNNTCQTAHSCDPWNPSRLYLQPSKSGYRNLAPSASRAFREHVWNCRPRPHPRALRTTLQRYHNTPSERPSNTTLPSALTSLSCLMTYSYVSIVTVAAGTARIMLVPSPA
ncbi:hypothetical protein TCAP_04108 [Tolypocladium capitatum]|uniref:Uncharacterized protein n=1 Tax=Tolypocladium capitatum TaxID=45235 RepID=A0A2K3QEI6_9HYPO|nr:hypothetical protein TCAP_04108 [Tolypocladium capitatum]